MKKRAVVLFVLALLFVSVLITSFVSAQTEPQGPGTLIKDAFNSLFDSTGWKDANLAPNVAKIFFLIMVTLIIYLVLENIFPTSSETPLKNRGLVFIISFIVAFLSTAYLTPEDIYALLGSYSALGLTLTSLVPFVILMAITYKAATEGKVPGIMLQYAAWIMFTAYSLYRLSYNLIGIGEGSQIVSWVLFGTTIVSLFVLIFNKPVRKWIFHAYLGALTESERDTLMKSVGFIKETARAGEKLAGSA